MSTSISYRSLMSVGKYFECILIYSAIDIGFSKKQSFRSQDINLAPGISSEIVLLNSSFDSKKDAAGDEASSGYLSMSPPTINLNLYNSYFSGRLSHKQIFICDCETFFYFFLYYKLYLVCCPYPIFNSIGKSLKFISNSSPPSISSISH